MIERKRRFDPQLLQDEDSLPFTNDSGAVVLLPQTVQVKSTNSVFVKYFSRIKRIRSNPGFIIRERNLIVFSTVTSVHVQEELLPQ